MSRFWDWLSCNLGVAEVKMVVVCNARLHSDQVVELQAQVEKLALAVGDLRENLNMDPMVDRPEDLDNYRGSGDPMMGA